MVSMRHNLERRMLQNLGRFLRLMPLLAFLIVAAVPGMAAETTGVAVIVSRNIRPYLEAVEGIKSTLTQDVKVEARIFFLEDYQGKSAALLVNEISESKFSMAVTVGPEATRFARQELRSMTRRRIYTMLLNPEEILPEEELLWGVSLRIPAGRQVELITGLMTNGARVGLLFDPNNNDVFFRAATVAAEKNGLTLIPIRVASPKDIPQMLQEAWVKIDYLWFIPDQTVSQESLVQYIIKEAITNRVGCIGYNRFFIESGAALSLVMDYREIGRQTGEIVLNLSAGKDCSLSVPAFNLEINHQVVKMLGLKLRTRPESGEAKP